MWNSWDSVDGALVADCAAVDALKETPPVPEVLKKIQALWI